MTIEREMAEFVQALPVTLSMREAAILLSLCDAGVKFISENAPGQIELSEIVRIRHKLHGAMGPFGDYIPYEVKERS